MPSFMDYLKKYAVYVVLLAGLVYNFGVFVTHSWTPDNATWLQVDGILVFFGLGSVRAALANLFQGVDLGPVGTWINGKKTYILAVAGALFNILVTFGVILPTDPIALFINSILGALGIGTFTLAMSSYKREALKLSPGLNAALNKNGV